MGRVICTLPEQQGRTRHPLADFPVARAFSVTAGCVPAPNDRFLSHGSYLHPSGTARAGPGAHCQNSQWLNPSKLLWVTRGGSCDPLVEFLISEAVSILPGQQGQGLGSARRHGRGRQCPLLEPKMVAAICVHPLSSCRQSPVAWGCSQGKKLLWLSCPSPGDSPNNGALPLWRSQASS